MSDDAATAGSTNGGRSPGGPATPLAGAPDEALILAIAAHRSREAFAALFGRYAGRVKAFLLRSGASHDEAEDGAQEVMVTLWRRAETFDPALAGAATWIFTIARNKRIDMMRRARRPAPDPEDPHFRPDDEAGAETRLSGRERDARVRAALARLSEDQLTVVRLAFFAGLSHAEIAERLETPLGTVKSRLRLSFRRLRDELGESFAEELRDD
ncbi:sigma-70 family RNA polymerase sigma factor [Limibaculum sp. FT325]|uniref:sigma-70 family RNA polymerase sigma factor n=1 Tax=Thermohalobaculum sediminis TaxID=2939436 RepID=UPI0020C054A8|nr:sigma-70 family RNA polymerase sigma factor [Limibaculum sediminis]MCL5776012.1 sigma-70 family RNA polymerase sigma factor [Limibaculum sediminis]